MKKVLIANRGEIAVQAIRAIHELNMQAVAVYSTVDANDLFVKMADETICIGSGQPADSYLNMGAILDAAVLTNADAIFPGYGFLSENADFAELCEKYGIKYIGPSAKVIDLMGNKSHAKNEMRKIGVPVIPGSDGFVKNLNDAVKIADEIGYPVMLKATAGGGGKGIRKANNETELIKAFNAAKQESKLSYNDDRLYIEKDLSDAKHIEMQAIADDFGNVVYFPERDCSLQRNHQKIIEESPCSEINEEERAYLGNIVVNAMKQINYKNTGTFEFLMDSEHNFYFMEMNTRLQVEYTITEEVADVEIIKAMLEVAAGKPLSFNQQDCKVKGYAIECRINAEKTAADFQPNPGKIETIHFPFGTKGVRIDTGIENGSVISPFYDSMIAKIIIHLPTKKAAINKMIRVIKELKITGVATNRRFLLDLLQDNNFVNGNFNNRYIEDVFLKKWMSGHEKNNNQPSTQTLKNRMQRTPDVWIKCPYCKKTIYKKTLGKYKECPNCHYAFRLGAKERIAMLCDEFHPLNSDIKTPTKFKDKKYLNKIKMAKDATGLNESVLTGTGLIDDHKVDIGVMDWRFIMGSLGIATGEIIAKLFEHATKYKLPVIIFSASGGARMQEGIESLMQMAKVSEAVAKHSEAGLLYISYLCDPTTGGVTASFAMQGDLLLSEPHALIGFAGRRVIEQTIQQIPPKDFQRAETLLHNGFLDAIVDRSNMKTTLSEILTIHEGGEINE